MLCDKKKKKKKTNEFALKKIGEVANFCLSSLPWMLIVRLTGTTFTDIRRNISVAGKRATATDDE